MSPSSHTGNLFQRQTHPANEFIWILKTDVQFCGRMITRTISVSKEKQWYTGMVVLLFNSENEAFFQHEVQSFPGTVQSGWHIALINSVRLGPRTNLCSGLHLQAMASIIFKYFSLKL